LYILPVLDLRVGSSPRIFEPVEGCQALTYSDDPIEQAIAVKETGAEWLQVVDLDGAFTGHPANLDVVRRIVKEVGLKIQFTGGLRSKEYLDAAFESGAERVILSTAAIRNIDLVKSAVLEYGDRIIGGIDTKDGKVAIEGWESVVPKTGLELAAEMREIGVKNVIYSDVRRDGSMKGPNYDALEELLGLGLNVYASGGISSLEDIKKLKALGITGVALGKPLYTGAFLLEDALAISK